MPVFRAACVLLLAVLPSGCGRGGASLPDELSGSQVGTMAERQLEADNPQLTAGILTCPDLDLRPGASVRCLRTTELSGGRVVKVAGTVQVASLDHGGRLHVTMDGSAREFGLAGHQLATDVARRYSHLHHVEPSRVECGYLRGAVGASITCRLEARGRRHDVDLVVTAVDRAAYRTVYVVRPHSSSNS